jgi:hypothetical protein
MSARAGTIRGGDTKALLLILAIGVQLAIVGAYLGMKTVFAGAPGTPAPISAATAPGTYGIASDVPVSFGSLVVGTAQTIEGVAARNLGGMNHGIAGYVPPDKAQVQVTVELTNRRRTPIAYSPEQFSLMSAGERLPIRSASIRPATLLPEASVEATLIFVAPRTGQALQLAFQDEGRAAPLLVDLGRVDTAPVDPDAHRTHQ